MAVRGITFSKQTVSSNDDSHIYKLLLNGREGTTKGCKMTYSKDDIYISDGYFFISNRLAEVPSMETISTPIVTTGTNYCRLVFEIDLSKTNTNSSFEQGYFKILSSAIAYPDIIQEDLENGGNVYQLPFAKFTKTVDGIGSFASELKNIGIAVENKKIYVSTSGNDASGDGSENLPFATIQHAIDTIPKDLAGYEITIEIASGKYSEEIFVSGLYGGMLKINFASGTTIGNITIYDSCVSLLGTELTIAASGKQYGIYCNRGANVICQVTRLNIIGAVYGIYALYGSTFSELYSTTITSCTYAVAALRASTIYLGTLAGEKNNNGIQSSGGIVYVSTISSTMASTLYTTLNGGRIYTGSQASVPSY